VTSEKPEAVSDEEAYGYKEKKPEARDK